MDVIYKDLHFLVDFKNFSFLEYRSGEMFILQPQLEALGYTDIRWGMGESDSFGPLTRTCAAVKDGELVHFIYG